MNVFDVRDRLIREYGDYVRSFIEIRDTRIDAEVERELRDGLLWPNPLLQLNPAFEPGIADHEGVTNRTQKRP
jgi:hypothetical protein